MPTTAISLLGNIRKSIDFGKGELGLQREVLPARYLILDLFRVLHRVPKTNPEKAEHPHKKRWDDCQLGW